MIKENIGIVLLRGEHLRDALMDSIRFLKKIKTAESILSITVPQKDKIIDDFASKKDAYISAKNLFEEAVNSKEEIVEE